MVVVLVLRVTFYFLVSPWSLFQFFLAGAVYDNYVVLGALISGLSAQPFFGGAFVI